MKLNVLVIASHPDDAELSCSGTIAVLISKGYKVGLLDLTRGELGTRGTPDTRALEADEASKILQLSIRENAGLEDGFFQPTRENLIHVAVFIRQYRPDIVLTNAIDDRHPDHGRGSRLVVDACFISGLTKVTSKLNGQLQSAWRPKAVYHYIQSKYIVPDIIVDISDFWEVKLASIRAFRSQFFDPGSKEPETYISQPQFLKFIEARCLQWGHAIGVNYGEGFTVDRHIGVKNLLDLI